jgi:acetyl-CoA C-acetyltransferase
MDDAVIISAVRTAIGKAGGSLANVPAWELARTAAVEAIARSGVDPAVFDDVIFGETVGGGGGTGRYVGLAAGVPHTTPGLTVIRACASGLEAVTQAATMIRAGVGEAFLTGGVESMSQQPWLMRKPQAAFPRKPPEIVVAPPSHPRELADLNVGVNVGESSAQRFGITRQMQDEWAFRSHQRAVAAIDEGRFAGQIVPVGDFAVDEHPRRNTTLDKLAALKPAFVKDGTVTAGNSSGINDGAAALVVMGAKRAQELGATPHAIIRGWASAGVDPAFTGTGPIEAVPKALKRAGLSTDDLDLIEINEAFAAQTVACVQELGLDAGKVNVNGGAIALGHPVGASGARILVTLLYELERTGGRYGAATLCAGGGMGSAAIIERI